MAYAPININVFMSAYSGAMAGMLADGRVLVDPANADYLNGCNNALNFAEALDTAWGAANATQLDVQSIQAACQGVFDSRLIESANTAAFYAGIAARIINLIQESDTVVTGQGIVPPQPGTGGGGGTTVFGAWAKGAGGGNVLPADSPFQAVAANSLVPVDTTGGAVTVKAPVGPSDGQVFGVKDATGKAALTPIQVTAIGPITIENPANAGNYGAAGVISAQGSCVMWKFRASDNKWIAFSGV